MFFKKVMISLLDHNMLPIMEDIKIKYIPRTDELIYVPEKEVYYRVINVIYNLTKIQNVLIIIEEYSTEKNK